MFKFLARCCEAILIFHLHQIIFSIYASIEFIYGSFIKTQHLLHSTMTTAPELSTDIKAEVYISDRVASPMVVGLTKPKIIIPTSITDQLQQDQLKAIVLHENAHIKRKDNWFGLLQEIVAILFWWSPIIRVFNQKIHVERSIYLFLCSCFCF